MKITPDKLMLDQDNFLRLDGSAGCKLIEMDGEVWLEFYDRDRLRSSCRGDHLLHIRLSDFITRIQELMPPL